MKTSQSFRIFQKIIVILIPIFLLMGMIDVSGVQAQENAPTATPDAETEAVATPLPGVPVYLGSDIVFYFRQRQGSLSPQERADRVSAQLEDLASNPFAPEPEFTTVESSEGIDIIVDGKLLLTVSEEDAAAIGMTPEEAAAAGVALIQKAISRTRAENTPQARFIRAITVLAILIGVIALLVAINRIYHVIITRIKDFADERRPSEGVTQQFIRSNLWIRLLIGVISLVRWLLIAILIIWAMPVILGVIPATAQLSKQMLELLLTPLKEFWAWFFANINNFATILLIVAFGFLLNRMVKSFFSELETGTISIGGFEPEWAPFTQRIVSFLIIIATAVVAFPYIPGSDSDAFRGISIFLGALFTLSSTAAVTNIVAGVIQTYTGAFKVGDVVKIGDTSGFVIEKRLLTTRVRTFKNEDVSLPNSSVLGNSVTNYSVMAKEGKLVLYTTITIGYDVPWQQVHSLMIEAAKETSDILPQPEPFVLQTSLNDFNVAYQINCYTERADRMPRIYSALHANIQEKFNAAGVEIMSPGFMALRDGNTVTIPADFLPDDYESPGFRIENS